MKQILTTTLSLVLFASLSPWATAAKPVARPNIVIVIARELGWSDTGYGGSPAAKTPNLDDMAGKGLRFDYFYSGGRGTPLAILSGRSPWRAGMPGRDPIRPGEILLPVALKQAGYNSAYFGLWSLGGNTSPTNKGLSPIAKGFDQAVWTPRQFGSDVKLFVNDSDSLVETKGDSSVAIMDQALSYIRKQVKAPDPFIVQLEFGLPHRGDFPNAAAAEFKALYEGKQLADFYGTVSGLDAAVGNLRSELRKLGIADNTIVWFVSSVGGDGEGNDPSRMGKWSLGYRVPGLLEWPARIKQPIKTNVVAGHMDLYPTLVEIAGAKVEKQPVLDGISLVPLIDGKMTERSKPMGFMFWERKGPPSHEKPDFIKDGEGVWIDGKYKLIVGKGKINETRGVGPLLYDIYADPAHKINLASSEPERILKMTQALDEWRTSVRASFDGKDFANPPSTPVAK